MLGFLGKFFDSNEKVINSLKPIVEKINGLEAEYQKLTDNQLKEKTAEFKERLTKGETLDDILTEAFAAVREAAKRTIGQRHFNVQLMGGIVLHQGKIAEMKTGEGKTLVATLPLYLNALEGKGAHLVTVNDYLARRDCAWMGPIYDKLGLKVSAINHEASYLFTLKKQDVDPTSIEYENLQPISRQEAYLADITYGTNNEFGFDFLRDNMVQSLEQIVLRRSDKSDVGASTAQTESRDSDQGVGKASEQGLHYAIVDEVDSILIDEARTPLIISAPAEESASLYRQFAMMVPKLAEKEDYEIDEKMRAVTLTDKGMKTVEKMLGLEKIYDTRSIQLVHHLEEALMAHALYKKDKDYVVKNGEVIIVDEFTGRLMPGRRYSEGLHQAIEAKEGVEVQRESDTLATISFQNLFRMYQKLAGMTGTAETEAEEFYKIYKLDVVVAPTNEPMIRKDLQDQIYKSEEAKFLAVAQEIKKRSEFGQPVLVGTISIEKSERLSRILKRMGVKHDVLNAKHHEREAKIIAQAGRPGNVTVATNMAGRGVDIVLGGSPFDKKEHEKVVKAGGLHVLGTERHEARRIDNQLRGRSGRQGDPGSSQFYVSMEDDLMRIFGGDRMKNLMNTLRLPDDVPIEHGLISRSIESAQKKVEGYNFDIRKHLVEYDDVANKHRQAIYSKRRKILAGLSRDSEAGAGGDVHQEIVDLMDEEARKQYLEKHKRVGKEVMDNVERLVYLRSIDTMWVEHLNAMELMRQGIGLRGYGQRDPLVEYKAEAFRLYQRLLGNINAQVVEILLKAEISPAPQPLAVEQPARAMQMQGADEQAAAGTFSKISESNTSSVEHTSPVSRQVTSKAQPSEPLEQPSASAPSGVEVTVRKRSDRPVSAQPSTSASFIPKVGRNEPCPCGSGKKYKKCHGR